MDKKSVLRIVFSCLVILTIVVMCYLFFSAYGITKLTREQIQEYIESSGAVAPIVFIGVSFLQVTFVPIPGAVTILAGNYIFGAWLSFLYSYIGMMLGGIVAFYLGRLIGRPFINWVAGGKEVADGWIKRLKGRESVFLFFAFLLPLFPDDLLCSIAGILPITFPTFLIMQLLTRATSIAGTLIFMSGELIPYQGAGLVIIGLLVFLCVIAFILSMKYVDKLNKFFDNFITKLLRSKKNREKTKR